MSNNINEERVADIAKQSDILLDMVRVARDVEIAKMLPRNITITELGHFEPKQVATIPKNISQKVLEYAHSLMFEDIEKKRELVNSLTKEDL